MPSLSLALLETLFVLSLAASLPSSSGLSSPYPDIITLPLTPDIITLLQQEQKRELTSLPALRYSSANRKRWFKNPIHVKVCCNSTRWPRPNTGSTGFGKTVDGG